MKSTVPPRRVVITRPRNSADGMATALRARGLQPILLPTVAVRPVLSGLQLDALLDRTTAADWILFTSAAAVRAIRNRLAARGKTSLPTALRVAAVGPATAAALRAMGARVDATPPIHNGAALVASLGDLRDRIVLYPRADIARPGTMDALRARGAILYDAIAYHTIPSQLDPVSVRELEHGVDAITFTSPSTANNFVQLLGPRAGDLLARVVVGCIGPTTAATARARGAYNIVMPSVATTAALVSVLADHFAERSQ